MAEQPLFFLVSIIDDALMGHWTFRASDELAVMRHLLKDPLDYQKVFRRLRLDLRHIEEVTPERLLQVIQNSYGPAHTDGVFYLIRVCPNEILQVADAPAHIRIS